MTAIFIQTSTTRSKSSPNDTHCWTELITIYLPSKEHFYDNRKSIQQKKRNPVKLVIHCSLARDERGETNVKCLTSIQPIINVDRNVYEACTQQMIIGDNELEFPTSMRNEIS